MFYFIFVFLFKFISILLNIDFINAGTQINFYLFFL